MLCYTASVTFPPNSQRLQDSHTQGCLSVGCPLASCKSWGHGTLKAGSLCHFCVHSYPDRGRGLEPRGGRMGAVHPPAVGRASLPRTTLSRQVGSMLSSVPDRNWTRTEGQPASLSGGHLGKVLLCMGESSRDSTQNNNRICSAKLMAKRRRRDLHSGPAPPAAREPKASGGACSESGMAAGHLLSLTFSPGGPRGPGSPLGPPRPFGPSGPSSPLGPGGPISPCNEKKRQ